MTEVDTTAGEVTRYNPVTDDWGTLQSQADEILGYDLARDELLDALVGVPHILTRVQFRPGISRPTGEKKDGKPVMRQGAYVSCEGVLAPEFNLTRINVARKASKLSAVMTITELPFKPGDHVVYNDGSTGIYRQIVQYLAAKGLVILPSPVTEIGPMGECSYDAIPSEWEACPGAEYTGITEDDGFLIAGFNIRLSVPRGLRLSSYENEYTAPGEPKVTRYLA